MLTRPRTRSEELAARARELTPGGVHSNVRMAGPKVCVERGAGAWLWDVDGNDYVDYLLGQGPMFLGHAPAAVNAAVTQALQRGSVFGAQHVLENAAGEILLDTLGWAEQVRFGLSGTEADQAALRLARAATGRRKFLRFEGHYHGWLDNVLSTFADGQALPASAGQLASHLADSVVVPFNDVTALQSALDEHGSDIAAIILEPMMCNNGAIPPRDGFLNDVRWLADKHGAVLIFDEVITGFRISPNGAVGRYGVTPDLATFGKAMAGGWPVSALAGRADLMGLIGTGEVNHSGTFNSSVPATAAVIAALTQLRDDPPYERIADHGTRLQAGLAEVAARHGVPLNIHGLPMAFHVSFAEPQLVQSYADLKGLDLPRYNAFVRVLAQHGVWVAGRGIWYVSAAHTDRELTVVLERFDTALTEEGRG